MNTAVIGSENGVQVEGRGKRGKGWRGKGRFLMLYISKWYGQTH